MKDPDVANSHCPARFFSDNIIIGCRRDNGRAGGRRPHASFDNALRTGGRPEAPQDMAPTGTALNTGEKVRSRWLKSFRRRFMEVTILFINSSPARVAVLRCEGPVFFRLASALTGCRAQRQPSAAVLNIDTAESLIGARTLPAGRRAARLRWRP